MGGLQLSIHKSHPNPYAGASFKNLKVDGGYLESYRKEISKREADLRKVMLRSFTYVLEDKGFSSSIHSVTMVWPSKAKTLLADGRNLMVKITYGPISRVERLELLKLVHSLGVLNSKDTPKALTFEFKASN